MNGPDTISNFRFPTNNWFELPYAFLLDDLNLFFAIFHSYYLTKVNKGTRDVRK